MTLPETRYTRSGDVNIAYQVVGDGPIDLLYSGGWITNVELGWEEPHIARFYERLASFSRLILFDKRGTGLSDRVPDDRPPTLEERTDDIRAVLDVVGSEHAALFGSSEGGSMCVLFAATYPGRVRALITHGIFAKRRWSPDHPWAPTWQERDEWLAGLAARWGGETDLSVIAPSLADDPSVKSWFARFARLSVSPSAAVALGRMNTDIDIRAVLPTIRVPTLMLHATGDRDARIEEGRWIAERIPGARLIELTGGDHVPFFANADRVVEEIQHFLTGARPPVEPDRFLATVLFTDIVEGTKRAAEIGDRRWRELVERHHGLVRAELRRHRGVEQDTAGDGFYATFDGPARAVRCALAVRDGVRELGIDIRAGVHTGECEQIGGKVGGLAAIIGARVRELAVPGEVLVSSTVRDLVPGSGLVFEERGPHRLKGIPDEWRVFAAV
ncbi:MAG: adenylate/guanylate cyclase domain-containing protein [Chloroflexi bacterium]|nr:adenylate/guanylate cyclase domain-containing protein [Chloroflexota bacterium]MDQ3401148.1 adenylate/guanylate cyclase domain-containing protein [Chloroflexota bacterium]